MKIDIKAIENLIDLTFKAGKQYAIARCKEIEALEIEIDRDDHYHERANEWLAERDKMKRSLLGLFSAAMETPEPQVKSLKNFMGFEIIIDPAVPENVIYIRDEATAKILGEIINIHCGNPQLFPKEEEKKSS